MDLTSGLLLLVAVVALFLTLTQNASVGLG
jgi:hypothetical protein